MLTLFEFALVYLDPTIEAASGGQPLAKLGINLLIATVILCTPSLKGGLRRPTVEPTQRWTSTWIFAAMALARSTKRSTSSPGAPWVTATAMRR